MREIGIHLEERVVVSIDRPAKTSKISGAESEFSGSLDKKERLIEFWLGSDPFRSSIAGGIIDDQEMGLRIDLLDFLPKFRKVIALLISRDNNDKGGIHEISI